MSPSRAKRSRPERETGAVHSEVEGVGREVSPAEDVHAAARTPTTSAVMRPRPRPCPLLRRWAAMVPSSVRACLDQPIEAGAVNRGLLLLAVPTLGAGSPVAVQGFVQVSPEPPRRDVVARHAGQELAALEGFPIPQ